MRLAQAKRNLKTALIRAFGAERVMISYIERKARLGPRITHIRYEVTANEWKTYKREDAVEFHGVAALFLIVETLLCHLLCDDVSATAEGERDVREWAKLPKRENPAT